MKITKNKKSFGEIEHKIFIIIPKKVIFSPELHRISNMIQEFLGGPDIEFIENQLQLNYVSTYEIFYTGLDYLLHAVIERIDIYKEDISGSIIDIIYNADDFSLSFYYGEAIYKMEYSAMKKILHIISLDKGIELVEYDKSTIGRTDQSDGANSRK
jgi:hypothetical protein